MTTSAIKKAYEFDLFELKKESYNKYIDNYPNYLKCMRSYKGFKEVTTYQSITDRLVIFDHVVWDSHENAIAADKQFQTSQVAISLMEPINLITFFDNMYLRKTFNNKATHTVFELNIYRVKEGNSDAHKAAQEKFYELVFNDAEGLAKINCFKPVLSSNIFLDTLYWSNLESANHAHQKYGNTNEFKKFKETISKFEEFVQMKELFNNSYCEKDSVFEPDFLGLVSPF